jgi:hypothetical protein
MTLHQEEMLLAAILAKEEMEEMEVMPKEVSPLERALT